jgi:hypothetical protein
MDILICILLIIRSVFRLVRLVAAFSLIESAPACPAHQVSRLVCINSPPPWPAPAAGPDVQQPRLLGRACISTGTRRLRRWRWRSAASAGTGRGDGVVGGDWKRARMGGEGGQALASIVVNIGHDIGSQSARPWQHLSGCGWSA